MATINTKWLWTMLLLGGLSCSENTASSPAEPTLGTTGIIPPRSTPQDTPADTLAEKNSPLALDLSKHQLFIDTTRNSTFYALLKHWVPSKWDHEAIDACLSTIQLITAPKNKPPRHFPTQFISMRKLRQEWILYDRCDGMDQRFEIRDTAFVFYGPIESHAAAILQLTAPTNRSLSIMLKPPPKASNNASKAFLHIQLIAPFVYQLTYKHEMVEQTIYATTPEHIEQFDLLVNHCPETKRLEFRAFDPPSTYNH